MRGHETLTIAETRGFEPLTGQCQCGEEFTSTRRSPSALYHAWREHINRYRAVEDLITSYLSRP